MRLIHGRFKKSDERGPASPLFTFEVAHTAAEQARGLMGRATLLPRQGMLFAFDAPGRHGFWMKDTGIPLDLAWLTADGTVLQVTQLHPYDETLRLPQQPARYAIELLAGTLAQHDVRVRDRLLLGWESQP